jgi:hypothetical protein
MTHPARLKPLRDHVDDSSTTRGDSTATIEHLRSDASTGAPHLQEDLTQQAILAILLSAHPAHRSVDELVRELAGSATGFVVRDRVNNGIRDLVGAGLAHRHGQFVFASRAAMRFDELRV